MVATRRSLVLGSFLIAAVASIVVAPSPASACGMIRMPTMRVRPAHADELLVQAGRRIERGDWAGAARVANRVAESDLARPDQRAQALAIVGWSAWQFGAKVRALSKFRQARKLDAGGEKIDGVLARVKAPEQLAALRSALEA
jgi:hypothetical protein